MRDLISLISSLPRFQKRHDRPADGLEFRTVARRRDRQQARFTSDFFVVETQFCSQRETGFPRKQSAQKASSLTMCSAGRDLPARSRCGLQNSGPTISFNGVLLLSFNTGIEAEIKKINGPAWGSDWKVKQQFYSGAAKDFRYFKDAWRNHAMHFREHYEASEAKIILDHVKSFMIHLADGGLKE